MDTKINKATDRDKEIYAEEDLYLSMELGDYIKDHPEEFRKSKESPLDEKEYIVSQATLLRLMRERGPRKNGFRWRITNGEVDCRTAYDVERTQIRGVRVGISAIGKSGIRWVAESSVFTSEEAARTRIKKFTERKAQLLKELGPLEKERQAHGLRMSSKRDKIAFIDRALEEKESLH